MNVCVHFIGVAADEYWSAMRVWGKPDFTHGRATWSCMGEIDRDDIVILGRGAFPKLGKWKRKPKLTAHQPCEEQANDRSL